MILTEYKTGIVLFFAFFIPFRAWAVGDDLERSYELRADFRSYDERTVRAQMEMTITNRGASPLNEIWFMLYPNRFEKPLGNLNDLNYRRIYPDGFSTGNLSLESMNDENGKKLTAVPIENRSVPEKALWKIQLQKPLMKGERTKIVLAYTLLVPEKFGSFGYFRGQLTLSGGWYPYVISYTDGDGFRPTDLPPSADWNVHLEIDSDAIVAGQAFKKEEKQIHRKIKARELSAVFAERIRIDTVSGQRLHVDIATPNRSKKISESLRGLIVQWLEYVEKTPELANFSGRLFLAQAPLREALVMEGENMTLFSDRAFQVISPLMQYHSTPFIRAYFYQLFFPQVSERENSRDYSWVTELVSWHWAKMFTLDREYKYVDARTLKPIRALSFLPAIDRVIYTPQFAFFDIFYDLVYPYDPVRDDALRFNHERPAGRTIHAHLEDELGESPTREAAQQYAGSNESFIELVSSKSARDLSMEFKQWTQARPSINYVLKKHRSKKVDGMYHHQVTVLRETEAIYVEPVELLVGTKDGKVQTLRWEGDGNEYTFEFKTVSKVNLLELDPRRRLLETKLSDNRKPPKYKLVLTDYLVDYDFNANEPNGYVSGQFRRSYGGNNRYNGSAYYFGDSYGAGVGYTRLFGRLIDRLRLSHAFSVDFQYLRTDQDLALADDPFSNSEDVVEVGRSGNVTSLGASYGFGNQLSYTNPLEGGYGSIGATWGTKYLGGDSSYYQIHLGGAWIFRLHPSHLLAFRSVFGISGPSDIPSQVQYNLGGINGIRGLSIKDERFQGRNLLLFSAEYRHFLIQHIDVNLWLFRIRDVQGALFADAGHTTDTVQEKANRLAFPSSEGTGFSDLFRIQDFATDAGYGIRLHVDWLGVNPGILRFDAAKSISEEGQSVRFYFGAVQSF